MTRQPLEEFLATKDESIHPMIVMLDRAILEAAPDVDAAIKWKQYMYSFDSRWMAPLCTIDTTKKGIALRFMSADLMADPLGVLRFGTSTMGTWDIPFDSKIAAADITRYVTDAVALHDARS